MGIFRARPTTYRTGNTYTVVMTAVPRSTVSNPKWEGVVPFSWTSETWRKALRVRVENPTKRLEAEELLLATGRTPSTKDLDLPASGKAPDMHQRLVGNLNYHDEGPKDECRDGRNHFFQILYCKSPTDAARLETLFHLWHGGYRHGDEYNSRMPIEPKGEPVTNVEPDFFVVQAV